jgi:hypothetical protein
MGKTKGKEKDAWVRSEQKSMQAMTFQIEKVWPSRGFL